MAKKLVVPVLFLLIMNSGNTLCMQKKLLKALPHASQNTTKFVRKLAKKIGIIRTGNIKVKICDWNGNGKPCELYNLKKCSCDGMCAYKDTILIGINCDKNPTSNRVKFMLGHKLYHLKKSRAEQYARSGMVLIDTMGFLGMAMSGLAAASEPTFMLLLPTIGILLAKAHRDVKEFLPGTCSEKILDEKIAKIGKNFMNGGIEYMSRKIKELESAEETNYTQEQIGNLYSRLTLLQKFKEKNYPEAGKLTKEVLEI